ncbi:hypothetical protein E5676_scaffold120G00990 [Cucumis melo var. makuwa]|uniref:Uncharacterized protein n=1 Tax=Cucumis melo var. makuwa TaxID=1194695 RepID=A0A5D3E089_CUCMM|nr:hypothetical protein E5676_scaffold120G00990 [Cucumis melo var. makuwa]
MKREVTDIDSRCLVPAGEGTKTKASSYQATICMTLFEALRGKCCRSPVCYGERRADKRVTLMNDVRISSLMWEKCLYDEEPSAIPFSVVPSSSVALVYSFPITSASTSSHRSSSTFPFMQISRLVVERQSELHNFLFTSYLPPFHASCFVSSQTKPHNPSRFFIGVDVKASLLFKAASVR